MKIEGVNGKCLDEFEVLNRIKLLKKRLIKRRSRVCQWLRNDNAGWGAEYRDAMDEVRVELNKLIKEIEEL